MALGAAASAALIALAIWIVLKRKLTPEERERRRRAALNEHRRTVEGILTETGQDALYYQYELAGVEYSASQDVAFMAAMLPADLTRFIGPVNVKYDPRNPANSIIICEDWSGLPAPLGAPAITEVKEEPACN
jgi:hypothetical protein